MSSAQRTEQQAAIPCWPRDEGRESKKESKVIVPATLLAATTVGTVCATRNKSPQAAHITRKITISSAFFHAYTNRIDRNDQGVWLALEFADDWFTTVVSPCLEAVTVTKITLSVTGI